MVGPCMRCVCGHALAAASPACIAAAPTAVPALDCCLLSPFSPSPCSCATAPRSFESGCAARWSRAVPRQREQRWRRTQGAQPRRRRRWRRQRRTKPCRTRISTWIFPPPPAAHLATLWPAPRAVWAARLQPAARTARPWSSRRLGQPPTARRRRRAAWRPWSLRQRRRPGRLLAGRPSCCRWSWRKSCCRWWRWVGVCVCVCVCGAGMDGDSNHYFSVQAAHPKLN